MQIHNGLPQIRVLCVLRRHQKMQRRACIASRMLSSSVVSPCQTLLQLARDHEYVTAKTIPSPSISGTVTRARHSVRAPRVCTSFMARRLCDFSVNLCNRSFSGRRIVFASTILLSWQRISFAATIVYRAREFCHKGEKSWIEAATR